MCNALNILQHSHHANAFYFNHTILVVGNKIGTLSVNIVHNDPLFHHNHDLHIDGLHEEGLKWAHEENSELPLKEIEHGVKRLD